MASWDTPSNAADGGGDPTWNTGVDTSNGGDTFGGVDTFNTNETAPMNVSGEENHGRGGGGSGCFNCGQDGHNKADCPNPRVFTGECRVCNKDGHMAKDCPEKPAMACRNCQEEGHTAVECTNQRKIDRSAIAEIDASVAWDNIMETVKEHDVDDIKAAIQQYVKACPDAQYHDLETAFRSHNLDLFLIAVEKPAMLSTLTNMDFQGNLDKKYTVSYRFSDKPARPREAQFWPSSPEDNLERLKDAGEVVQRGLTKCSNCENLGHIAKNCPEQKMEKERVVIMCINCNEVGHRSRDCPEPRVDKFACKNCGQSGHKAVDCPEPRKAGPDVECRKCGEMGHFSRDCPQGGGGRSHGCFNCGEEGHQSRDCTQPKKMICRNCEKDGHRANECPEPKNMAKVQCRNCDEFGHTSRECPKPRDYSRIQCSNCGEMGHTKVRCTKATAAPDNDFGTGDTNGSNDASGFNTGVFNAEGFNADGFNGNDTFKADDAAGTWQAGAATGFGGDASWPASGGVEW